MPDLSSSSEVVAIPPAGVLNERHDPGPPPLQFSLKTLFVATAVMCVVFALAGRLNAVGLAALLWFLALVAAHMIATAVGTRASAHAPSRSRLPRDEQSPSNVFDPVRDCAPTTRLGGNARLGWSLWVGTVVGAMVGCGVGTMLVASHNGGRLGWPALALAAVSSTGIGAFLSFLAGSCAKVASRAWREATRSAGPRRSDS